MAGDDDIVGPGDFELAPESGTDAELVLDHGWQTHAAIKRMKLAKGANIPPMVNLKTISRISLAQHLQRAGLAKKGE
jgi:hypothetical protein